MRLNSLFALAATLIAGSTAARPCAVDASFGNQGVARWMIDGNSSLVATRILVDASGYLLVSGTGTAADSTGFVFAVRLDPNGQPVAGFGSGGIARHAVPNSIGERTRLRGAALAVDGSMVLATATDELSRAWHLRADGSWNEEFGTDGSVVVSCTPFSAGEEVWDIAVDATGRVLVRGEKYQAQTSTPFIVRLQSDGTEDGSFGGFGCRFTPGGQLVPLSAGYDLVRREYSPSAIVIQRFRDDGDPDTSFGDAGTRRTPIPLELDIGRALRTDDALLLTIEKKYLEPLSIGLARFGQDGTLDGTFGAGGISLVPFAPALQIGAYASARMTNGDLVVTGLVSNGSLTARTAIATLDPSGEQRCAQSFEIGVGAEPASSAIDVVTFGDRAFVLVAASAAPFEWEGAVLAIDQGAVFADGFED